MRKCKFRELGGSHIIFICNFDLFLYNRHITYPRMKGKAVLLQVMYETIIIIRKQETKNRI